MIVVFPFLCRFEMSVKLETCQRAHTLGKFHDKSFAKAPPIRALPAGRDLFQGGVGCLSWREGVRTSSWFCHPKATPGGAAFPSCSFQLRSQTAHQPDPAHSPDDRRDFVIQHCAFCKSQHSPLKEGSPAATIRLGLGGDIPRMLVSFDDGASKESGFPSYGHGP